MDYICSLTGKSPSTTGAGSEGALTKGPFNALCATADLNNALVSMLLTGYAGFSTAAGYIGPHYRVDHDISLLIPEIWCRLFPQERDPQRLIEAGHLEKLRGLRVRGPHGAGQPARLPHHRQVRAHLLRPRLRQPRRGVHRRDPEARDAGPGGLRRRRGQHRRGAAAGGAKPTSRTAASRTPARRCGRCCTSWRTGTSKGRTRRHPEVRALFTREALLASDWYHERLVIKQARDVALWQRHVRTLSEFLGCPGHGDEAERLGIAARLEHARSELERVSAPEYLTSLVGTIGADPIHRAGRGRPDRGARGMAGVRAAGRPVGAGS